MIIGKRIEKLLVVEVLPNSKIRCLCDCGNERIVKVGHFNTGSMKSCGCHVKRHFMYGSREYISWSNMIQRCHNKNNKRYVDYGAIGIIVCDRWRSSFSDFYMDMGSCPEKYQIDRINNNLGYYPENCRWCTAKQNMRNRNSTRVYFINGTKFMSAKDAAIANGVSCNTILAWCNGRTTRTISKKTNKIIVRVYEKKNGCYSEKIYPQ